MISRLHLRRQAFLFVKREILIVSKFFWYVGLFLSKALDRTNGFFLAVFEREMFPSPPILVRTEQGNNGEGSRDATPDGEEISAKRGNPQENSKHDLERKSKKLKKVKTKAKDGSRRAWKKSVN